MLHWLACLLDLQRVANKTIPFFLLHPFGKPILKCYLPPRPYALPLLTALLLSSVFCNKDFCCCTPSYSECLDNVGNVRKIEKTRKHLKVPKACSWLSPPILWHYVFNRWKVCIHISSTYFFKAYSSCIREFSDHFSTLVLFLRNLWYFFKRNIELFKILGAQGRGINT